MHGLNECPAQHVVAEDAWLKSDDERKKLITSLCDCVTKKSVKLCYLNEATNEERDLVAEYELQLLSVGMFYLEYCDAIRQGDGERVIRCWRYLLPIFYNSKRTNYSKEALLLLYQHKYLLSPRQSKQLMYSRFINTQGIKGKNIPCDLHMEHLNRVCKDAIRDLGANKTTIAITRVAKTLGTLHPVLQQFDLENGIRERIGNHKKVNSQEDIKVLTDNLMKYKVLTSQPNRSSHPSFPRPKYLLHNRTQKELLDYIEDHLPL